VERRIAGVPPRVWAHHLPTSGIYDRHVAYDELLASRIRALLAGERGIQQKRMFGGLAFLIGGNMAIAASRLGGVLVRVDPETSDRLVDRTKAEVAIMRGRPMTGLLRVAAEDVATKRQLEKWVTLGASYAESLPAKKAASPR
jgi:TfoX/Sxy family transcriptional regulator of competence genes